MTPGLIPVNRVKLDLTHPLVALKPACIWIPGQGDINLVTGNKLTATGSIATKANSFGLMSYGANSDYLTFSAPACSASGYTALVYGYNSGSGGASQATIISSVGSVGSDGVYYTHYWYTPTLGYLQSNAYDFGGYHSYVLGMTSAGRLQHLRDNVEKNGANGGYDVPGAGNWSWVAPSSAAGEGGAQFFGLWTNVQPSVIYGWLGTTYLSRPPTDMFVPA